MGPFILSISGGVAGSKAEAGSPWARWSNWFRHFVRNTASFPPNKVICTQRGNKCWNICLLVKMIVLTRFSLLHVALQSKFGWVFPSCRLVWFINSLGNLIVQRYRFHPSSARRLSRGRTYYRFRMVNLNILVNGGPRSFICYSSRGSNGSMQIA